MSLRRDGYRPRSIDNTIDLMLEAFGAVCVEGPKYCGKTWTSLSHVNSSIMIGDPDRNFENRRLVNLDVNRALTGERPHLIDEWQEIPQIWDAVRMEVDRRPDNGQFILTGSSTPVRKGVMHSGAGRIGHVRMRTMSLYESGDSDGSVSLMDMFDETFQPTEGCTTSLELLMDLTVRGGWPRNIGMRTEAAMLTNRGYLETCIKDVASLDGSNRDENKIRMIVRSLARNESTLATKSKIVSDVEGGTVSNNTLDHYLDNLERSFLLNDQPPFDPGYRSSVRVGKVSKRHLTDPSLAVAAMNLSPRKLMDDLLTYGFLFESMCERDLDIYARSEWGSLYHYRDSNGKEIDAVVELDDGRWGAFEIKLGTNQIDTAAKNLLDIDDYIAQRGGRRPSVLCVICGLTSASYRRNDGVYVVSPLQLRGRGLESP